MKNNVLRCTALASTILVATGCANKPGQPDLATQFKQTFASADPCSNNSRNIGIAAGALVGVVLGNSMGNGSTQSKIVGAALGSVVGGMIGADMDRKRCELSKVAKKYDLDIVFAEVGSNGDVKALDSGFKAPAPNPATPSAAPDIVGSTVTIRDKTGLAGQFEIGSDKLTPRAEEYFAAIASQYAPDTVLAAQTDPQKKEDVRKQLALRRILLVGHTDDTGSSQLNADLSERRARAVAAFLKQKGVPEANIYYQGAGETLPISDNRTEDGRALNRRVEIVEVADDATFKKYLDIRKPQTAFYRTEPSPSSAEGKSVPTAPVKPQVASNSASTNAAKVTKPSIAPPINFGGAPYTVATAKIDTGSIKPDKSFSLIPKAQADDSILAVDCSYDRPRAVGTVKSLRDGSSYRTSEHLPQLYGKTWASDVNGNLVVINHLAVLRGNGAPANLPELKVYAQYRPGSNKKPEVSEEPAVNSYFVEKGLLYRIFPRGDGGLKCMDLLFAVDGATTAKAGKLIYVGGTNQFVADFRLQIQ